MSQWRKTTQPCGLSDSSPVHCLWGVSIYLWIGLDPAILHILLALTNWFVVSFNMWLHLSQLILLLSSLPPDLASVRIKIWLPRPLLGLRLCSAALFPPGSDKAPHAEVRQLDINFQELITTTNHVWATSVPGAAAHGPLRTSTGTPTSSMLCSR